MTATKAPTRAQPPTRDDVEKEMEAFRQLVVASRGRESVGPAAGRSVTRLNTLHEQAPVLFTAEDVRWLNVLCGFLGQRLAAHQPSQEHTFRSKRKGDSLDRCWRCETRVDERFTETCELCSDHHFKWMRCPVCKACGCQRKGRVLV